MSNFTFWCGGYSVRDIQWLVKVLAELKNNDWDPRFPIVFCGAGWQPSIRDHAIVSLLETLRANTSARSLIIRHSDLDLKAQKSLAHLLQDNVCIQSVTLQSLRDGTKPLTLPVELFRNTNLSEIILSDCTLSDAGCCALGRLIRCSRVLNSLVLSKVKIAGGVAPWATALVQAQSLRSLKLDSLFLSLGDAEHLLSGLERNESLNDLQLENLDFDCRHSSGLAKLLARNSRLKGLSLRRNNLTGEAIEMMVYGGLVKNKTLQTLALSHNPVGDDGAAHLVVGLQRNDTIQELKLVECEIWQSGISDVVRSLPTFRGVKRLSLDRNDTDNCATELIFALQSNFNVVHVLDSLPRVLQMERMMGKKAGSWGLVDWYLRMNKNKRRFLAEPEFSQALVPAVYCRANADPSTLYYFIRRAPGFCVATPSSHDSK